MKKSIIVFLTSALLSAVTVAYGWAFVSGQIGKATLTEETIAGSIDAADGLTVGFRADSADTLHWINSYDYSTGETKSSFKKGDMTKTADSSIYDDFRFTGWSAAPFSTLLAYDGLEGLQEKKIQAFYDEIQHEVMESDSESIPEAGGKIRLADYLDYYPVSFRFQFGTKIFNSDNALTGLKVYDEMNMLSPEKVAAYNDEIALYTAFNSMFKIPVISNEYQEYKVSGVDDYDCKTSLGYRTEIKKPLGEGKDYYEFDPIIAIQEENIMDGKKWFHPDLSKVLTYEADSAEADETDTSYVGKTAAQYDLKNRMFFIVNNRTAKGKPVDVSQIGDGYGIYELPIETTATATVRKSRRSSTLPSPKPLAGELSMVYPLDKTAEYVEMSLSGAHRYLAVFSVKDGTYFVELIDADNWTSNGPVEVFPASEKMTYVWGDDGSLAVTNHNGYVAVFARTGNEKEPYEIIYSGKVPDDFDEAFFDTEMVSKEKSYAQYRYCIDKGLAVASKDGKVAMAQNLLVSGSEADVGNAASRTADIRNAALECAVIDRTGVIYRGIIKNSIVDLDYDMSDSEIQAVMHLSGSGVMKFTSNAAADQVIEPVRNENRCEW